MTSTTSNSPTALAALRSKLESVVTQFDRKQETLAAKNPRRHYSIYALGLYMNRVDSVVADIATGSSLARALYDNYQADMLSALERAFCLAVTHHGDSNRDTGRPA